MTIDLRTCRSGNVGADPFRVQAAERDKERLTLRIERFAGGETEGGVRRRCQKQSVKG